MLEHKGLYAMVEDLKVPREFGSAKFADFCAGHFRKLASLQRWLEGVVGA